jgi:hypothetical protein
MLKSIMLTVDVFDWQIPQKPRARKAVEHGPARPPRPAVTAVGRVCSRAWRWEGPRGSPWAAEQASGLKSVPQLAGGAAGRARGARDLALGGAETSRATPRHSSAVRLQTPATPIPRSRACGLRPGRRQSCSTVVSERVSSPAAAFVVVVSNLTAAFPGAALRGTRLPW